MFGQYRRALLCLNHNPNLNNFITANSISLLLHHSLPFTSSSDSFTFSYLLNTCGFSPQTATKLSTRVHLDNSATPDSVLALFNSHGFSLSQTRRIIQTYPNLLGYSAHKTLSPKLTFLLSKGASTSDLITIVTKNPRILYFGLEHAISPRYDFIKKFTLSDESTLRAIKSCPSIVYLKYPAQNIQILLENGVPESKITMLLRYWGSCLVAVTPAFRNAVEEVKRLGFKPDKTLFLVAVCAKLVRKSLWEKKIELYGKWGWSEETVRSAFVRSPWCMLVSEAKIEAMMEFCVKQLGCDPLFFAKYPVLIAFSLEKRIVPRALVVQFLMSKGLVKDVNWAAAFIASESLFLRKFVVSFEKEASQLMKLYEEKRDLLT